MAEQTITRAKYFPAIVRLPDGRELRRRYVILAQGGPEHGLWVFDKPDHVEFHAPINWLATSPPKTGRASHNGVDVHLTDGGIAVVTPGAGCRCGALGRWGGPGWSNKVGAWT